MTRPIRDSEPLSLTPIAGLHKDLSLYTHDPQSDLVSQRLAAQRCWEPFETRLWLGAQRAGDVVVDVGANLGYFSLLSALAEAAPAQVHAFEPAADNFALLEKNLALNGCSDLVCTHHAALSSVNGIGRLRRSETNLGDHQIYAGDGERSEEPINARRGDDALAAHCDRIDLLKIDTQGSELRAIDGLWPLLERSRESLRILVELTPFSLALAGASGRQLIERLARLSLPFHIVDHIEARLVRSDAAALARWCDNVDAVPDDRGFMNIFVGAAPAALAPGED
ncbi:MAG: FkbM family methyltransferase [Pseudomonadota bacterium]